MTPDKPQQVNPGPDTTIDPCIFLCELYNTPHCANPDNGCISRQEFFMALAQRDAALIAQEREKWEREKDQMYVLTLSALREISVDIELKEYRKSCIHDPVCQWLCTAMNCPYHVALDHHNASMAAQVREDVLEEYLEILNDETLPDYDVRARLKHLMRESLRSEVKK